MPTMRAIIDLLEAKRGDLTLFHGTSEDAETIRQTGLVPDHSGSHEAVFLTDNPQLALEYAETDQDRTGNDAITLVSVRVSDLDSSYLWADHDHSTADTWQESLAECDQCMYMGAIPASLLKIESY